MLFAVAIIVTVAIVFAVGALAVDHLDRMSPAVADAPIPQVLPNYALSAKDVRSARFSLALRGYRMAEVDVMLSRLAEELAWRDEELTRRDDEIVKLAEFARVDHASRGRGDRQEGSETSVSEAGGWSDP